MRRAMIVIAALLGCLPLPVAAQAGLRDSAAAILTAWQAHDARAVLASVHGRIQLSLPGVDPAAPVTATQASALLGSYLEGAREVTLELRAARSTDSEQGYAEISRRYRVHGEADPRQETLLLGFRLGAGGWALSELRVVQ